MPENDANPDILIVEDNLDVLTVLGSLLRRKGYAVASVATYNAALDWIRRVPPLVILDLGLPGGTGESLIGEFKRFRSDAFIVVFTADHDDMRLMRARRFGADETLTKPIDNIGVLIKVLEKRLPPPKRDETSGEPSGVK